MIKFSKTKQNKTKKSSIFYIYPLFVKYEIFFIFEFGFIYKEHMAKSGNGKTFYMLNFYSLV